MEALINTSSDISLSLLLHAFTFQHEIKIWGMHKQQTYPLVVESLIDFSPISFFSVGRLFLSHLHSFNKKMCLLHDTFGQPAEFLLMNYLGDLSSQTQSKLILSFSPNKQVGSISITTADCCRCLHKYGCTTEQNKEFSKAEPGRPLNINDQKVFPVMLNQSSLKYFLQFLCRHF